MVSFAADFVRSVTGVGVGGGRGEAEAEVEEDEAAEDEEEEDGGYRSFARGRQAKGVLYRISAFDDPLRERMTAYVHGGAMDADLRYAREVYGLVNTSGRKDFDQFWESPWVEEHIRDTTRKRKLDAQQRAMAVRSYIRASTTTPLGAPGVAGGAAPSEPGHVDRFLDTVDKLTDWEDRHGSQDVVKTVSRMVQSFEHIAIGSLQGLLDTAACTSYRPAVRMHLDPAYITLPAADSGEGGATVSSIACTLRRSPALFHLFAELVAAEIIWAEATNGARNTTIYMCRQLREKQCDAGMAVIRSLAGLLRSGADPLPHDRLGMPLMSVDGSMCVTRGVLVVLPGRISATYVLDIQEQDGVAMDMSRIQTIRVTRVVTDPDLPPPTSVPTVTPTPTPRRRRAAAAGARY